MKIVETSDRRIRKKNSEIKKIFVL